MSSPSPFENFPRVTTGNSNSLANISSYTASGVGIPGTGLQSEVHNSLDPSHAAGSQSFAESDGIANGNSSHAEGGIGSIADGNFSHSEGTSHARLSYSHAEGQSTDCGSVAGHTEGINTSTSVVADAAHAEGQNTQANNIAAHSQGVGSVASGYASDAGGDRGTSSGRASFTRGDRCIASGDNSDSSGSRNNSSGRNSLTRGSSNSAPGDDSVALGEGNISHFKQTVLGKYAVDDHISDNAETPGQAFLKVGNGTSDVDRLDVLYASEKIVAGFGRGSFPNLSDITTCNLRIAIIGDSIASSGNSGGFLEFAIMQCRGFWSRVVNASIAGNTLVQMEARFDTDIAPFTPDVVFISGGSNDGTLTNAVKTAVISLAKKCRKIRARPIFILPAQKVGFTGPLAVMGNWISNFCSSVGIETIQPWDGILVQSTGLLNPAALDGLGVHPLHPYAWDAGTVIALNRVPDSKASACMNILTNGTAGQNTWVIDPYNTSGTVDKGSRWGGSTSVGGSITWSKTLTTLPDRGYWQNARMLLPVTSGANGDLNIAAPGGVPIPVGDFEVRYRVKITECTNASVDLYMNFNNDAGVDVGGGRKSFLSACRGLVDGRVTYTLASPAGAYRPEIKFKVTKVDDALDAALTISVAMIEPRTLVV